MNAACSGFDKHILLSNLGSLRVVYLEQEAMFTELLHLACLKIVFGVQISKQNSISVQFLFDKLAAFFDCSLVRTKQLGQNGAQTLARSLPYYMTDLKNDASTKGEK